jgi:DNA-binding MarR family transcriptional regulator
MSDLPFGFERPEDSPGFLLWQTTITWQRLIKKELEPYDISHAQFVIMAILLWLSGNNHKPTQIAIAKLSKLDKMTISKSLKKLVAQKLVKREESQEDSRAKLVQLTFQGKELIIQLVPIIEDIDKRFFSKIDKNQQVSLIETLGNLAK